MDVKNALRKSRVLIAGCLFCLSGILSARADELKTETTFPHTLAELDHWYAQPATNGAVFFLKAFEVLSNNAPLRVYTNSGRMSGQISAAINWPADDALTNKPLSRATKNSFQPFIQAMDKAWPFLQQGAQCKASRYPIDLTAGWEGMMYHLLSLGPITLGIDYRAIVKADAGQADAAVDSVLMELSVAQSLKGEPLLVSQQIRGRYQHRAIGGLAQIINRVPLTTNQLERLQDAFNRLEAEETAGNGFERAWIGEKVMAESYLNLSSNELQRLGLEVMSDCHGIEEIGFTTNDLPKLISKGMETRIADRKYLTEAYGQIFSLWRQGYPKRFEIDQVYQTLLSQLAQSQFYFTLATNEDHAVKIVAREGAVVVRLRLAKIAVALERYRFAHQNRYPDSLNALVPEYLPAVPEDIFADAPPQYHRRGEGYVLYSIGSDRKDDGGSKKEDEVFEIIHPPGHAIIE
jgi:hypothetical protein